jgi:hypothetical protein
MSVHMSRKGVQMPAAVSERLQIARVEIASGCFSPCEVACALADVERDVFSQAHLLGDEEFMQWSDLLGEAMQGKLTYERIQGIPALVPIKNDCEFLGCMCSGTSARGG